MEVQPLDAHYKGLGFVSQNGWNKKWFNFSYKWHWLPMRSNHMENLTNLYHEADTNQYTCYM